MKNNLIFIVCVCLGGMASSPLGATCAEQTIVGYDAFNRPITVTVSMRDNEGLTAAEQQGCFKYDGARIADKAYTTEVTSILDVLEGLQGKTEKFRRVPDLTLSFRDNYLADEGFRSICKFIQGHSEWRDHLVFLDLWNNRITRESLGELKSLLDCTRKDFRIKLSLNYVKPDEIWGEFPSSDYRERIICTSS